MYVLCNKVFYVVLLSIGVESVFFLRIICHNGFKCGVVYNFIRTCLRLLTLCLLDILILRLLDFLSH